MASTDGLHPRVVLSLQHVLAAMDALGFPMRLLEGVRSAERQQRLYAQGRTGPGPIVTNADGVHVLSNHQLQADGMGHAVDCCFVGLKPWTGPWEAYGACGKALGLKWGGDFRERGKPFPDSAHLELPISLLDHPA